MTNPTLRAMNEIVSILQEGPRNFGYLASNVSADSTEVEIALDNLMATDEIFKSSEGYYALKG